MSIKLKGSSDGSVSFDAPADTSPSGSDITLVLPTTVGSAEQFLKNSGTAGTLEFSSMVETSTGVGIGTSSPDSELSIGTGNTNNRIDLADERAYVGYDTSYGSTGALYLDGGGSSNKDIILQPVSTGNVGIATSTASGANLVIATNSNGGSGIKLIGKSANGGAEIDFRNNADSTLNGFIEFNDNGGILSTVVSQPQVFRTNNTERMRIDSDGRLLLGLTSSIGGDAIFQVQGSGNRKAHFHQPDSGGSIIQFTNTTTGTGTSDGFEVALNGSEDGQIWLYESGNIKFGTANSERMRIASNGRVGIGTSSPLARTHLDGTDNDTDNVLFLTAANLASGAGGRLSFGGNYDGTNRTSWADIKGSKENATSGHYGGYLSFSTRENGGSNTERVRITSGGKVRIACSNMGSDPSASNSGLQLKDTSVGAITSAASVTTGSSHAVFLNPNGVCGTINTSGSGTAYNTSSDYRLKENVVDLNGAITRVKQLAPKRFNFIADADTTVDGFLAHEAQTVVPEAVSGTHNGIEVWRQGEELPDGVSVGDNKLDDDGNTIPDYQGIDQSKLVPLLTAALQEAIAKIETLETKVAALEAQ